VGPQPQPFVSLGRLCRKGYQIQINMQRAIRLVFGSTPCSAATVQHAAAQLSSVAAPVGGYTPVTTQLWLERLQPCSEGGAVGAGSGETKRITYAFSSDAVLREMYRNPWDRIRIGRLMEVVVSAGGHAGLGHSCKWMLISHNRFSCQCALWGLCTGRQRDTLQPACSLHCSGIMAAPRIK
jgi:hypothetical protein